MVFTRYILVTRYVELSVRSNFSFLEGASHPEELAAQSAVLGLSGFAVTDANTLAGVVRGHMAAKRLSLPFIVGTELRLEDWRTPILAWPESRRAYGRLCKLLTRGKLRAAKGECRFFLDDVLELGEGLMFAPSPSLAARKMIEPRLDRLVGALRSAFPSHVWLAGARLFGVNDRDWLARLNAQARKAEVPLLAVGHVLYHEPARTPLQNVLACIREHVTIHEAGELVTPNAERHLKSPEEMARLFADYPQAVEETLHIAGRAGFSLDELRYEYPMEAAGLSGSPQEELERLAREGLRRRYPDGAPEKIVSMLSYELRLIGELQYAPYFLTVYDIVRYAREQGILCQGRGSAANSVVCYCLGVTSVNPVEIEGLFERFISAERNEPPDIDVDFEHERREEVIQYIYEKYGRTRAGIAATVITYRAKSALREVGKAMGLTTDVVSALSGMARGWREGRLRDDVASDCGLNPHSPEIAQTLALAREIVGFPRHLSQHTGGFVMTEGPLEELIPIGNAAMDDRTFVEWDKDDLDALGIIKVDVLGLGMLSCLARSFCLLKEHYGLDLEIASVPAEEPEVYDMICRADTLGVFQIESRAQMTMLPRLRPRKYYDLVIEVAIVRPGPIQGDMVHPYLRRRRGEEKVTFPSKELEEILGKTLGVPLFQEQAMKIAIVAGGFTPVEADSLRRAMATFRKTGTIHTFGEKLVDGMKARGYDTEFAERCFKQIEGFGEYGFPESHAASFALLVYVSCWLKCRYPDVFSAAMLNSQPLGFYAPAQLVRDAMEHGVEIRSVDVNNSDVDCALETSDGGARVHPRHREMIGVMKNAYAVRLGFNQVKGLAEDDAKAIVEARRASPFDSLRDMWLRTRLPRAVLERLAKADAFASLGLSRREALWAVRAVAPGSAEAEPPLFAQMKMLAHEEETRLPQMPIGEEVLHDYRTLRLSLKAHPAQFLRDRLSEKKYTENGRLPTVSEGTRLAVAGLVLVRQRPGTASGVIFATLEDETGVANIVIWPRVYERFRREVLAARFMGVSGRVQRDGEVIHVVADKIVDLSDLLTQLSEDVGEDVHAYANADEFRHGSERSDPRTNREEKRQYVEARMAAIMPRSRDFH